jgi:hypothetical protein
MMRQFRPLVCERPVATDAFQRRRRYVNVALATSRRWQPPPMHTYTHTFIQKHEKNEDV